MNERVVHVWSHPVTRIDPPGPLTASEFSVLDAARYECMAPGCVYFSWAAGPFRGTP